MIGSVKIGNRDVIIPHYHIVARYDSLEKLSKACDKWLEEQDNALMGNSQHLEQVAIGAPIVVEWARSSFHYSQAFQLRRKMQ